MPWIPLGDNHKYPASVDIVQIHDSLYDAADDIVKTVIRNLFSKVEIAKMLKQKLHSNNYGLFVIAVATVI